jgi:N-dimethylarginine dimethylaminohydrolase
MSSADYFSTDQAINPYYGETTPDGERAKAEHAEIKGLFEQAGIVVDTTPAPADSQDGVYTANWALVRGSKAVLARLPGPRKAEEAASRQALEARGFEVVEVPGDWHFSGQGDALPFGGMLFCGKGYRSDERAQAFVAETLGFERIQLQTIPVLDAIGNPKMNAVTGWPDSFFYDLDLALSIIKAPDEHQGGIVAYCPDAFLPESQETLRRLKGFEKIEVDFTEATQGFACNLVSTGDTVIMSNRAPKLAAALKKRGLTVLSPEVTELVKGGGFIRCVSLTLE